MDYLRRQAAPLSERVWKALDEAVVGAARHVLAARRVATFDGPQGWEHVATRLGTSTPCRSAEGQAVVCVPDVVLLFEVRAHDDGPGAAYRATFLYELDGTVRRSEPAAASDPSTDGSPVGGGSPE